MVKLIELKSGGAFIKELMDDPNITVARTPYGAEPGAYKLYAKRAVVWKGVKGEALKNIGGVVKSGKNKGRPLGQVLYENAKRLAEISKKLSGGRYRGNVVVYNPYKGRYETMPYKAAIMLKLKNPSAEIVKQMPSRRALRMSMEEWASKVDSFVATV